MAYRSYKPYMPYKAYKPYNIAKSNAAVLPFCLLNLSFCRFLQLGTCFDAFLVETY